MIAIKRIEPHQAPEAKRLVLTVAREYFQWPESIEEIIKRFDERGELRDMDDIQSQYFDRKGLFLVVLDDGRMVGTGAIRALEGDICQLRRMWLLPPYQRRGIGSRLVEMLFEFARQAGFKTVRLKTDVKQTGAIRFYERLGFRLVARGGSDGNDLTMEMPLPNATQP